MKIMVYRDCDTRFRLRKVIIEAFDTQGRLINRERMFAGPFFAKRLAWRKAGMVRRARIMQSSWMGY